MIEYPNYRRKDLVLGALIYYATHQRLHCKIIEVCISYLKGGEIALTFQSNLSYLDECPKEIQGE